jgi:hypothetical protein
MYLHPILLEPFDHHGFAATRIPIELDRERLGDELGDRDKLVLAQLRPINVAQVCPCATPTRRCTLARSSETALISWSFANVFTQTGPDIHQSQISRMGNSETF